jgi:hypothetical protein
VLAHRPVNCERLLRAQVGLRVIVQLSTSTIAANLLAGAGPRCLAAAHAGAEAALDAFAAPLPVQQPGAALSALLRRASDDLAALHARQVPLPSMLLRVFSVFRRPPSQIVQPFSNAVHGFDALVPFPRVM